VDNWKYLRFRRNPYDDLPLFEDEGVSDSQNIQNLFRKEPQQKYDAILLTNNGLSISSEYWSHRPGKNHDFDPMKLKGKVVDYATYFKHAEENQAQEKKMGAKRSSLPEIKQTALESELRVKEIKESYFKKYLKQQDEIIKFNKEKAKLAEQFSAANDINT
jgi:hypothetical protein